MLCMYNIFTYTIFTIYIDKKHTNIELIYVQENCACYVLKNTKFSSDSTYYFMRNNFFGIPNIG